VGDGFAKVIENEGLGLSFVMSERAVEQQMVFVKRRNGLCLCAYSGYHEYNI
jgi:hypothetical protein